MHFPKTLLLFGESNLARKEKWGIEIEQKSLNPSGLKFAKNHQQKGTSSVHINAQIITESIEQSNDLNRLLSSTGVNSKLQSKSNT